MKIKILVAISALIVLGCIIYFEQTQQPYNNINMVTNNLSKQTANSDIVANTDNPANPEAIKIKSDNKTLATKAIELPNFPITIIGNKIIKNIYDIKSKKLVIHFWASWCNICKNEFKDIIKYSKINREITVIAISVDDDRDALGKYLDELNTEHNITGIKNLYFSWDQNKSISLEIFGTQMLPENYIVTHHDNIYEVEEKTIGKTNWAELLKSNTAQSD